MYFRSVLTLSLLAAIGLVSCAPAATPAPAATEASLPAASPVSDFVIQPTATVQPPAVITEAPVTEPPVAVATSRGPNLEATNPSTVSLAAGQLQLVEFFRFT